MTGAKGLRDIAVVFAARVLIAYLQCYGRAGSEAVVQARKNFYRIGFTPLCNVARGAWTAPVELTLDIGNIKPQPRRTTIYNTTNCRTVRFAKIGDTKKRAKSTT